LVWENAKVVARTTPIPINKMVFLRCMVNIQKESFPIYN
jgi:hypothetical protein